MLLVSKFVAGLAPTSPNAFAWFGVFVANLGNISGGRRFTSLAKGLLGRLDAKQVAGSVLCLSAEVQSFVEPMQSAKELQLDAISASLSTGETHFACMVRMQYVINLFWSGEPLSTTKRQLEKAITFMEDLDHQVSLGFMLIMRRTVDTLMLAESEPETQVEDVHRRIAENRNPHQKKAL